jgi:Glycosyltransferase family 87
MDGANQTADQAVSPVLRRRSFLRWPRQILGPAPGLLEINLACWGLYIGFEIVPLFVRLWIQFRAGAGISNLLPVDFIYFYGIGRLAKEYPLTRLYDYSLQLKIFNDIYVLREGDYGPSPYPPWVALFFSLFARAPLATAYLLWMGTSIVLYLTGIAASIQAIFPRKRLEASLALCFALSFYPFVMNTLANGQIASLAVFSVGLAILLERRSNLFYSGLALSILAYKPTLLLLIIPMLLATRRLRTLFGFIAGVAFLMLAATAFGGIQVWPAYAQFLSYFGRAAGLAGQSALRTWEYVDFSSLSHAVHRGRSGAGLAILAVATAVIASFLSIQLWKSASRGRPAHYLAWAATLTWTLLLNVYVPIYDSVLVTIALILTFGAVREIGWALAEEWTVVLAVSISGVSWITASIAKTYSIQLLTIFLFVLGLVQLFLLHSLNRPRPPQKEQTSLVA